jgi:hypothetical protein
MEVNAVFELKKRKGIWVTIGWGLIGVTWNTWFVFVLLDRSILFWKEALRMPALLLL